MQKGWKIFWISAAIFLLMAAYYEAILFMTSDSEIIIQGQLREKGTIEFNASDYPVVVDRGKYPELSAFEKGISVKYESMLQNFSERYKKYGYRCELGPTISRLKFTYLKPRLDIYQIESYCKVPADPSPYTGMPRIMFYVHQADIVMFYNVTAHFTDAFDKLENLDQLKEYSDSYVDNLAIDLDSALNNSILMGLNPKIDFGNCSFISDIPKLASTVSKEGNGFIYEGLKLEEVNDIRAYYIKYSITSDGQFTKDKDEMLVLCPDMGVIY